MSVCHIGDASQNIGCLVNANPLAVGYGGNHGDLWEGADPLSNGTCSGETVGLRIHELGAGVARVPAPAGSSQPSYPLRTKLYMNSLVGFAGIAPTTADPAPQEELELTEYEAEAANIDGIMVQYGEFQLPFRPNGTGPASDGGAPAPEPFCEDFNEYLSGCAPSGGAGNLNGCANNVGISSTFGTIPSDPSNNAGPDGGVPSNAAAAGNPGATTSTICGNGIIEDYEDCDPGTASTAATSPAVPAAPLPTGCGSCSTVCRCSNL
ncbi:MAG TPA: hypothetical protein VEK07_25080 [Polyangiaceae bacterium]|nr:hypothetical protein [Polyangiaceae bacterium]